MKCFAFCSSLEMKPIRLTFVLLVVSVFQETLTEPEYRLPQDVIPLSYKLFIKPDLHSGTYIGHVEVQCQVQIPTHTITLHSKNLNVNKAYLNNDTELQIANKEIYDFLILTSETQLNGGQIYKVNIDFEGDMKNKTYGFYRGHDVIEGQNM